jgi:hypothetical protein
VLAAALGASALSTVVFILAPDLGALIAGLFAQYAPHPTTLVFEV